MPLLRDKLDPVPELAARRADQPISKLEFPFGFSAWLVTRYDDVRQVLADADAFSNDFANLTAAATGRAAPAADPGGLGFADPPDHTRLRRILTPEFTMRRLGRLQPRIADIIDQQLDRMATAGPGVDLVSSFATPIPSLVISELLGVPYSEREAFAQLSESRFDIFANLGDPMGAVTESLIYLKTLVQRERDQPGEGMLGMIVREHGDAITDDELAGLADGLLTGGHETTASMLALGALVLLQQPDLATRLRHDDTHTAAIVDELLRYLTVVQVAFPRFARRDLQIGDQHIDKGDMLLCSLTSANRDPNLAAEPDQVHPPQASTAHLAFGHGIHRCVGAELAKMELRAAYPALLRRFPGLQLDIDVADINYRQYSIVHGIDNLPVSW
ncbi:cytochrome P450 [Nakamurella endophytica]